MTAPAVCTAQKKTGAPCTARALPGSALCFGHDPTKAAERLAARRRGGRGRSTAARVKGHLPPHLQDAQQRLTRLLDDVESGTVTPRAGEVLGGLISRLIELVKFWRELSADAEILDRISSLERRLST
jgi:hypothetical protein